MIHQRLLMQAVQGSDPVLMEFVQALSPKILEHFAVIPALGGSGKPRPAPDFDVPEHLRSYSAEEMARFSRSNPDQSMATHILNGIFAGMRLATKLPSNKAMNVEEKKLWLLGYIVHDYTKVYGLKVPASELPAARLLVERLGEQMDFEQFLSNWKHWLDDVVWLGQNTQTKEGANLNTPDYTNLRTSLRRLEVLRLLSSISDILVHIQSPAMDTTTEANLRAKFAALFGAENAPRLAYHKLSEVKGLLSNIVNNIVVENLVEQNCEPYLFFPNGVIYLAPQNNAPVISQQIISEKVWNHLLEILAGGSKNNDSDENIDEHDDLPESDEDNGGFQLKRDRMKGIIKLPDVVLTLYDYDAQRLINLGVFAAMKLAPPEAQNRLEKIGKGNLGLVNDQRVNQLGMFLHYIEGVLSKKLFPTAKDITVTLINALELSNVITESDAKLQKGGSPYGWFYTAAVFLSQPSKRGTDPGELIKIMQYVGKRIAGLLDEQKIVTTKESVFKTALSRYILNLIEINGAIVSGNSFSDEISSYIRTKSNRKHQCSLCSSPFENSKQTESVVLFFPQQYSNKNPLGGSDKRGICPICTLEMMLRIVQQGASSGTFQKQRAIYVWFYPTYFFTTETAQVVKSYIDELQDLPIFKFLNHLRRNGFDIQGLLTFDGFIKGDENEDRSLTINRQEYSKHDKATLFGFALHPLGKKTTETDAWITPVLYALTLPLLLDLKVVVTPSYMPIYNTGAEFHETAILDAPHQFTRYAIGKDRFRVDEILPALIRLLELYDLHVDVFAESNDLHWNLINAIAKDVATDPYYVFSYFERKERDPKKKVELTSYVVNRYLEIYNSLGGEEKMGIVGEIVSAYAQFYRADWGKQSSAYAVLKPFSEAADVIVESDPKTEKDDLILLVAGAVGDLMERVWGNQADGFDPIVFSKDSGLSGNDRRALSREKQMAFAALFVEKVFHEYCNGDRALLRERTNRLRSAARFYYLSNYSYTKKETNND